MDPPGGSSTKGSRAQGSIAKDAYITNVVMHFKWEAAREAADPSGAAGGGDQSLRPMAGDGVGVVRPEMLVCLGATAVRAVIGPKHRVMRDHGRLVDSKLGVEAIATLHPSAILRADDADRETAMKMLVGDLRAVRRKLG